MSRHEWLEYADVYAIGALDGEDLKRFESHLAAGCPQCEQQLRDSQTVLAELARSLPLVSPPPHLKRNLMRRVESDLTKQQARPDQPRHRPNWNRLAVAASVLLVVGGIGVLGWDDWTGRQELRNLQSENSSLRTRVGLQKQVIWFLDDPQVRTVALAGLQPSPQASGRVLWRPSDGTGYLLARGLPKPANGKTYALWAIVAAGPVPAGLFTVDDQGRAQVPIAKLALADQGSILKFAVTLEPAAGGPTPTGSMLLIGSTQDVAPA